jgi:hypothetical protein
MLRASMQGWRTGVALLVAGGAFVAGAIVGQRREAPPSPLEPAPKVRAELEVEGDPLTRAWQQAIGHPRDASAWLLLGDLESEHDESEAAEHSYRTAVSLLSSFKGNKRRHPGRHSSRRGRRRLRPSALSNSSQASPHLWQPFRADWKLRFSIERLNPDSTGRLCRRRTQPSALEFSLGSVTRR